MVKRLDEALGRLLDVLKSLQLDDSTIVLFTSDHGCHFKTRNDEYKRSCHESSIRVPTALQGPGFYGGFEIRELVTILDLLPTLLDAAGLPIPPGLHGRSVLPLLDRQEGEWPDDVFIQISESQVGRALRTRRWKYGLEAPGKDPLADASSDHYVETHLYDLQVDPYELTNLVGFRSHQEIAAILRGRLLDRMKAAGETVPHIEPAPVRDSGWRRVVDAHV